jgi:hypothetical protein
VCSIRFLGRGHSVSFQLISNCVLRMQCTPRRAVPQALEEENTARDAANASTSGNGALPSTQPSAGARPQGDGRRDAITYLQSHKPLQSNTQALPPNLQSDTQAQSDADTQALPSQLQSNAEGLPPPLQVQTAAQSDTEQKQRRKKLWIAAIKPPLYSVAITPVMVSSGICQAGYGL